MRRTLPRQRVLTLFPTCRPDTAENVHSKGFNYRYAQGLDSDVISASGLIKFTNYKKCVSRTDLRTRVHSICRTPAALPFAEVTVKVDGKEVEDTEIKIDVDACQAKSAAEIGSALAGKEMIPNQGPRAQVIQQNVWGFFSAVPKPIFASK